MKKPSESCFVLVKFDIYEFILIIKTFKCIFKLQISTINTQ